MTYQPHNGSGLLLPESVRESIGFPGVGTDWREPILDDSEASYLPLWSAESDQYDRAGFETEQELQFARRVCRHLARKSAYAINGHRVRGIYIVGFGHAPKAVAKKGTVPKGQQPTEQHQAAITAAQSVIDEFAKVNKWTQRQREIVRRRDRDGECFLRFFAGEDGVLRVRFVEPSQVSTPPSSDAKNIRLGIEHQAGDVESVLAYWIDGKRVDVRDIQHRKGDNVDMNVVRGVPLLWPVLEILRAVPKIRRNMSAGAAIQSSVAYVRTLEGTTKAAARTLQLDAAEARGTSPLTGAVMPYEVSRPGKIITKSQNVSYDFPFSNTRYDQYVGVIRDNLLEVAAAIGVPEFMLTSNAENANYSSTMIAESPAVMLFQTQQNSMIEEDMEVYDRAIQAAVAVRRLPPDVQQLVEIECEPPSMVVRNTLQEAQEMQIYQTQRIMSPQTVSQRLGLDYDQEQANLAAHDEAYGASSPITMPFDDPGGQPGDSQSGGQPTAQQFA